MVVLGGGRKAITRMMARRWCMLVASFGFWTSDGNEGDRRGRRLLSVEKCCG